MAEGNLVPPRPAVAIGSAQSAVPSAASSSLLLPSLSPRLPFHRPLGLCPAPRGLRGTRELSLWKTDRTWSGNRGWVPGQDWPPSPLQMDGQWGSLTENSREATGTTTTHNSILLSLPFPETRGEGRRGFKPGIGMARGRRSPAPSLASAGYSVR